jgi:hypothetical protein
MGTMTDYVDDVIDDVVDVETVPVSLDAFVRVLVDGLVDETVRAHEAAEACGPLVSPTPMALATNLLEDAVGKRDDFLDFLGGERDGSDEDGIERRPPDGRFRAARLLSRERGGGGFRHRGRRGRRRGGRARASRSVEAFRRDSRRRGWRVFFSSSDGATKKRREIAARYERVHHAETRASVRPAALRRRVGRKRRRRLGGFDALGFYRYSVEYVSQHPPLFVRVATLAEGLGFRV